MKPTDGFHPVIWGGKGLELESSIDIDTLEVTLSFPGSGSVPLVSAWEILFYHVYLKNKKKKKNFI